MGFVKLLKIASNDPNDIDQAVIATESDWIGHLEPASAPLTGLKIARCLASPWRLLEWRAPISSGCLTKLLRQVSIAQLTPNARAGAYRRVNGPRNAIRKLICAAMRLTREVLPLSARQMKRNFLGLCLSAPQAGFVAPLAGSRTGRKR